METNETPASATSAQIRQTCRPGTQMQATAIALQVVRRDLEPMPIGILEVDGMRDVVILELEGDAARLEALPRGREVGPARAKRQMSHRQRLAIRRGARTPGSDGEQRQRRRAD